MFVPIKIKYKKVFQRNSFKNKELKINKTSLFFGKFALVATSKGFLGYKEIEAARRVILKHTKKIGFVWTRVRPDSPCTKNKVGMRMGKGKGDVSFWVSKISVGTVLFEVTGDLKVEQVKKIFKEAATKLSLNTRIII